MCAILHYDPLPVRQFERVGRMKRGRQCKKNLCSKGQANGKHLIKRALQPFPGRKGTDRVTVSSFSVDLGMAQGKNDYFHFANIGRWGWVAPQ